MNEYIKYNYLRIVLIVLISLFVVSLFKNISYPLFWADESMTVMGGVRVLEFGYPKVHDGKNVLYDLQHPDKSLGIDKKTDAYIGGANWGMYYFAVPGIKLAEMSKDLFTKTAIIRITFALAGLAGLALLALLGVQFFHAKLSKTGLLTMFVFFELISVPLVLHLREARYYSLTVLFMALAIFIYAKYRILKKGGYPSYLVLLIVSLFLLFFTFSPVYFIFISAVFIFESIILVKQLVSGYSGRRHVTTMALPSRKGPFKDYLQYILPVIFSLFSVSPLTVFFDLFHIGNEMAQYYANTSNMDALGMYRNNLLFIWKYFSEADFIYLAFFLNAALFCIFVARRISNELYSFDMFKIKFYLFLTCFFVVYCLAIAKIPNPLFSRYLIPLQPVLALMIIVGVAMIYNYISQHQSTFLTYCKSALVVIFAGFILFNITRNGEYLKGHVYELMHQYRGPLDYVIPFIKGAYPNTENLVIATNYEETSFMYYLHSKVIIGHVGNNIEQDILTTPDIIMYRRWWRDFREIFRDFFKKENYERISFPVIDYPLNNIPELSWRPPVMHPFRTLESSDEEFKTAIFVRKTVP